MVRKVADDDCKPICKRLGYAIRQVFQLNLTIFPAVLSQSYAYYIRCMMCIIQMQLNY